MQDQPSSYHAVEQRSWSSLPGGNCMISGRDQAGPAIASHWLPPSPAQFIRAEPSPALWPPGTNNRCPRTACQCGCCPPVGYVCRLPVSLELIYVVSLTPSCRAPTLPAPDVSGSQGHNREEEKQQQKKNYQCKGGSYAPLCLARGTAFTLITDMNAVN